MANQTTLIQRLFSKIGRDSSVTRQDVMVDNLSRLIASPLPRRNMLKLLVMSISGAVVARFAGGAAQAQQATACCNNVKFNPSTQCCTPQGVQTKHPITDLAACPNRVAHPGSPAPPNGCGTTDFKVPDSYGIANFLPCCNNHDTCWGTCKSNRGGCDLNFQSCLVQSCSIYLLLFEIPELYLSCLLVADIYFLGVDQTSRGTEAYISAQKEACDCCDSPGGHSACGSKGICCLQDQICVNGRCTDTSACAGAVCGTFTNCSVNDDCQCYTTAEGTGQCAHNEFCAGLQNCTSSSQCGSGSICAVNTCCGSAGVCLPLCGGSVASKIAVSGLPASTGPTSSGKQLR